MNIDDIRKNIDTVDKQLIKLLAVRGSYVAQIAELKKRHGMEALQPERYQAMTADRRAFANKLDVPAELIDDIFTVIHSHSVAAQIDS